MNKLKLQNETLQKQLQDFMEEQRKMRTDNGGKTPEGESCHLTCPKDDDSDEIKIAAEEAEEDRLEGLGGGTTSICGHVRYYSLQLWDGLGFFGFDDTKLDRLIGKPLDFLTKLSSVRWFILTFGTFALVFYAMFQEVLKYQTLKTKEIKLEEKDEYQFDIRDSMPFRYVHWFWLSQLFPKARAFQTANLDNEDVYQHEAGRLIPDVYDDFDYFDNKYLEWYICKNSQIYYQEENFFDAVGEGTWTETMKIPF